MVLLQRNNRFNVTLFWSDYLMRCQRLPIEERACRIARLGGADYPLRTYAPPPLPRQRSKCVIKKCWKNIDFELNNYSKFQNLLANTPQALLSTGATPMSGRGMEAALSGQIAPVYAPVASPAPPSPAMGPLSNIMSMSTPAANDIIPQLQVIQDKQRTDRGRVGQVEDGQRQGRTRR